MDQFRWVAKEAVTLFAFVLMGSFFLLALWMSLSLDQQLLSEFKNDKISLILESDQEAELRAWAEGQEQVLSYALFSGEENKATLQKLYPELKNVLESLEASFFPISATLSVTQVEPVIEGLRAVGLQAREQIVHQAPRDLQVFLFGLSAVFFTLWLLTLVLVLYFQLERMSFQESRRWSLMKMLGAQARDIFWPLCGFQLLRVLVASTLAVFLATLAARQFEAFFQWGWSPLSWPVLSLFVVFSLLIAAASLFALFGLKFKRVQLG